MSHLELLLWKNCSGVNVIVSDTGGLGEIVQHDFDGMKSYVSNPNSLADCILFVHLIPKRRNNERH